MIPAGTPVNIYRVEDGKDLYVMVCPHDSTLTVRLPFYDTSEDLLLGLGV